MTDHNELQKASTTLRGNLVQLDYLKELLSKVSMTATQQREVSEQLHRITVNFQSAIVNIDDLANRIPIIGQVN